jgi:hypothetical protein
MVRSNRPKRQQPGPAAEAPSPPTLEQLRAAFTPGDRLHPVPDDVLVTDVTAGGVPAHWLTAPGADAGHTAASAACWSTWPP